MSINVLAFNCSQNEQDGNTARILNPLLEGMKNAGANIELFYTNRLQIEKCRACTEDPAFISPGECMIVDDMKYIYPKMRAADIWIFASPNYKSSTNSALFKLLDRLEPLFDPFSGHTNGNSLNIIDKSKKGKILLVSTDNDFEKSSFDSLIQHMESISLLFGREFIGSILRPHAWTLKATDLFKKKINEILSKVEQAGSDIIKTGTLEAPLSNAIKADIVSRNAFILELVNN